MTNDKFHKILLKVRYNMPVVYEVNKLDKYMLSVVSRDLLENDKLVIENINIICNDIQDSVIRNKYNKVYKI